MSFHRDAPAISADGADVHAFVSPDRPDTVTIISTYRPPRMPADAPEFAEFGDDVLYEIHVDDNGDGRPDLSYQFRFRTELRNQRTFLYNTGPIESLDSANWNRRQFYSVTRVDAGGKHTVLARTLPCPPCHVGPPSVPDYVALAGEAVHELDSGEKVFAGHRAADQGHVQSLAVQLPLALVRRPGPEAVIGIWTSASPRWARLCPGSGPDFGDVQAGMLWLDTAVPPPAEPERFPYLRVPHPRGRSSGLPG
jgi:hypothetical protein